MCASFLWLLFAFYFSIILLSSWHTFFMLLFMWILFMVCRFVESCADDTRLQRRSSFANASNVCWYFVWQRTQIVYLQSIQKHSNGKFSVLSMHFPFLYLHFFRFFFSSCHWRCRIYFFLSFFQLFMFAFFVEYLLYVYCSLEYPSTFICMLYCIVIFSCRWRCLTVASW